MVLGMRILPLLGHDPAQAAPAVSELAIQPGAVPLLATYAPERCWETPGNARLCGSGGWTGRARVWSETTASGACRRHRRACRAPAAAQPTPTSITRRGPRRARRRRQLDQQAREFYSAVFAAIDRKDWTRRETLLDQRPRLAC
jgi:hypothetical protein